MKGIAITRALTLQLFRLPLLVYDYNKLFRFRSVAEIGANPTKHLAQLSTYAPNGKVKLFIDDKESGLQVGITKSVTQKRICVVFRGSDERVDWYHNVLVLKRPIIGDGVYVHRGFHKQLYDNDNYKRITEALQREIGSEPSFDVYVLGHSLGGGLSTLFGYLFSLETDRPVQVLSFASPRVGNKRFKGAFESRPNLRHYRFTNKRDLVPAIPIIRYHHVGEHIQMDGTRCRRGNGNTLFKSWSIKDHDINEYFTSLQNSKCLFPSE